MHHIAQFEGGFAAVMGISHCFSNFKLIEAKRASIVMKAFECDMWNAVDCCDQAHEKQSIPRTL
jgi:hypothetical protein